MIATELGADELYKLGRSVGRLLDRYEFTWHASVNYGQGAWVPGPFGQLLLEMEAAIKEQNGPKRRIKRAARLSCAKIPGH